MDLAFGARPADQATAEKVVPRSIPTGVISGWLDVLLISSFVAVESNARSELHLQNPAGVLR